jgi:hypothetical protein
MRVDNHLTWHSDHLLLLSRIFEFVGIGGVLCVGRIEE